VAAEFKFTNPGTRPLILQNAQAADPHCQVRFSHAPVLPKKSGSIVVSCRIYDAGFYNKVTTAQFVTGNPIRTTTARLFLTGTLKTAQADDSCSTVRLDGPGGSMEKIAGDMPVVSQTLGTCSFQAAVQMFDAWRIRHENFGIPRFTSPVELDFRMQRPSHGNNLDGGHIEDNLIRLRTEGGCPRNYFQTGTGVDSDEMFYANLYDAFVREKSAADVVAKSATLRSMFPSYPFNRSANASVMKKAFADKNFVDFIAELIPPKCSTEEKLRTYRPYRVVTRNFSKTIFGYDWHESDGVRQEIHRELDKGGLNAMPIGISYCSSVLYAGKSFREIKSSYDANCGNHASTVIGRRKNPKTGSCEFLLRNSWGASPCYANDWVCIAKTSLVWVSADTLSDSIYSTVRMEER
jgi:hypothetical protein